MFDSGFIQVKYIDTFTVAGWTVLWGPVAVRVAPVFWEGIMTMKNFFLHSSRLFSFWL